MFNSDRKVTVSVFENDDSSRTGHAPPEAEPSSDEPVPTVFPNAESSSTESGFGTASDEPADDAGSAAIGKQLAGLSAQIEVFHTRSEQYESIIRRMQSRIEELQSDQVRTLLKPVINRLAALYTEASHAAIRAAERGDAKSQKDFGYFADEIEEGLSMLDIESLNTQVGDGFDGSRHAARGAVATDNATLDRKVANVIRQGFTYVGAERVLLPTIVKVYRFDPASISTEPDTDSVGTSSSSADQIFVEGVL